MAASYVVHSMVSSKLSKDTVLASKPIYEESVPSPPNSASTADLYLKNMNSQCLKNLLASEADGEVSSLSGLRPFFFLNWLKLKFSNFKLNKIKYQ